jgi:hypothetical protein
MSEVERVSFQEIYRRVCELIAPWSDVHYTETELCRLHAHVAQAASLIPRQPLERLRRRAEDQRDARSILLLGD